ncbi:MAG: competence/damage-inducible protein A [Bacteroidales bacterium]|nr:competence/damage-inducible protein A [Bacteroidales bacterium]
MKAHIISIGDELLIGQVVNTNASWMAAELNKQNIDVSRIVTISDDADDIRTNIEKSMAEADVVLVTGGLGPTKDDITKKTLADMFHSQLVVHQPSLDNVTDYFAKRGLPLSEVNKQQALVLADCEPIRNMVGTAPTMWIERNGRVVVSMPGVPFEMQWVMSHHIVPKLVSRMGHEAIVHKTVMTFGIGESFLSDKIEPWETNLPTNIKLAYLPQAGKVRLRLTAHGNDKNALIALVDKEVEKLQGYIADNIYGYDDESMESIVGRLLLERGETLATAESCTGGLVGRKVVAIAGASNYYQGGIIAYSNDIKHQLLNVPEETLQQHGAVSSETAIAMAEGCRKAFQTDWAVATTGISGPDGGTDENPRGTVWIAVAGKHNTIAEKFVFATTREQHQERSANQAIFSLWLQLRQSK